MQRYLAALISVAMLAVFAGSSSGPTIVAAQSSPDSLSSSPPDTTNYNRALLPEDQRVSPAVAPPLVASIRDVVVSNTDANLTNTDTFNDGEPTIAINPANPNEIVISAFSGSWGANAPIWHSLDGGNTWTKRFTVPAPPGFAVGGCPCDQAFDYGRGNRLSGTFLATDIFGGTTTNPASAAAWGWPLVAGVTQRANAAAVGNGNADQPWLLVNRDPTIAAQDNVYIAYDDFGAGPAMRVTVARGTNPPFFTVDNQSGTSTGFVNPGHRLAVDPRNGAVYSLFQRVTAAAADAAPKNINYMLNRSTDGGTTWTLNGNAGGIIVANANSSQPRPKFGTVNALLGGVLHAAVDPTNGDLYYIHGARDGVTGNNRLGIARLTTNGVGVMSVASTGFVTGQIQAALPSVAVNSEGIVGVLYDTFDGFSAANFPMFSAHFATSTDQGATFTDNVLLSFVSSAQDNGNSRQRVLGDYQQVKALGATFYGTFTANGATLGRPFANHDPIFFRATVSGFKLGLNGTTAYAEAPHAAELNLTGSWTVEAWVKDTNPNFNHARARILAKGDTVGPEVPYLLGVDSNGLFAGLRAGGIPSVVRYDLGANNVSTSSLHHVAATLNASNRELSLYLDGGRVARTTVPTLSTGNTLPLSIGRSGPSGDYWKGLLDDVRIWNLVRTDQEIATNFRKEIASAPGLVGSWRFNEGFGTTAADSAGAPQNGILQGGATWVGAAP